jgi:hypothetical protein
LYCLRSSLVNIRRGPAVKKALAQLFIFPAGVSVYRALGSPFRQQRTERAKCARRIVVCAPRGDRGGALRSRGAIRRGKKQKVKQSQIFGAKYRAFGLAPKKETAAKGIKARLSLGQRSDFTAPPPPTPRRFTSSALFFLSFMFAFLV